MITITVTPSFDSLAQSARRMAEEILPSAFESMAAQSRDIMLQHLQMLAPVGTHPSGPSDAREAGTFRDSLAGNIEEVGAVHYTVDFVGEQPLATYITHGTAAHVIEPVHAKMLAWYGDNGQIVFRAHVDHPGTAPNDFMKQAVDAAVPEMAVAFEQTIRTAISAYSSEASA